MTRGSSAPVRLATLVLAVPLLLGGVTGCKGKSATSAQTAPGAGNVAPSNPAAGSAGAGGASGSCPATDTAARVKGARKCLHEGQFCSTDAAKDYAKAGFACVKKNGRAVLRKR